MTKTCGQGKMLFEKTYLQSLKCMWIVRATKKVQTATHQPLDGQNENLSQGIVKLSFAFTSVTFGQFIAIGQQREKMAFCTQNCLKNFCPTKSQFMTQLYMSGLRWKVQTGASSEKFFLPFLRNTLWSVHNFRMKPLSRSNKMRKVQLGFPFGELQAVETVHSETYTEIQGSVLNISFCRVFEAWMSRPLHTKRQRQLMAMFPSILGVMQCQRWVCTNPLLLPMDDTGNITLDQRYALVWMGLYQYGIQHRRVLYLVLNIAVWAAYM